MSSPYSPIRGEYGEKAVLRTYEILGSHNISFQSAKDYWGDQYSFKKDLEYGDIIFFDLWFDIKRNSISVESFENFKGFGYIVIHHYLNNNFVITREKLVEVHTNLLTESLLSGDLGWKYKNFYKYELPSLHDFLKLCESEVYNINKPK